MLCSYSTKLLIFLYFFYLNDLRFAFFTLFFCYCRRFSKGVKCFKIRRYIRWESGYDAGRKPYRWRIVTHASKKNHMHCTAGASGCDNVEFCRILSVLLFIHQHGLCSPWKPRQLQFEECSTGYIYENRLWSFYSNYVLSIEYRFYKSGSTFTFSLKSNLKVSGINP